MAEPYDEDKTRGPEKPCYGRFSPWRFCWMFFHAIVDYDSDIIGITYWMLYYYISHSLFLLLYLNLFFLFSTIFVVIFCRCRYFLGFERRHFWDSRALEIPDSFSVLIFFIYELLLTWNMYEKVSIWIIKYSAKYDKICRIETFKDYVMPFAKFVTAIWNFF